MTFQTKLYVEQNHFVLNLIKQIDLLRFIIRYLLLFDYSFCDKICDKIKHAISKERGITDSINHDSARTIIDSHGSLPTKKRLTFHNLIILSKSFVNNMKNNYHYNIFLEKALYKNKSNTEYFT